LSKEAWNLFGELSKATHAKGEKFLETPDRGDTVTRYRTDSFQRWFSNMKQVFETTTTALALKYSSIFKQDRLFLFYKLDTHCIIALAHVTDGREPTRQPKTHINLPNHDQPIEIQTSTQFSIWIKGCV